MVRAPGGQIRIKAICHHRYRIGLSFQDRKLGYHRLSLGQLILTAVRHQHAACADGGVEHFHKTLLGADI